MLARNQGVQITALGLEFGAICLRGVHKVHRLQNAGTDNGIVAVFDSLLCNGDVPEVTVKKLLGVPVIFDPLEVMEAFAEVIGYKNFFESPVSVI